MSAPIRLLVGASLVFWFTVGEPLMAQTSTLPTSPSSLPYVQSTRLASDAWTLEKGALSDLEQTYDKILKFGDASPELIEKRIQFGKDLEATRKLLASFKNRAAAVDSGASSIAREFTAYRKRFNEFSASRAEDHRKISNVLKPRRCPDCGKIHPPKQEEVKQARILDALIQMESDRIQKEADRLSQLAKEHNRRVKEIRDGLDSARRKLERLTSAINSAMYFDQLKTNAFDLANTLSRGPSSTPGTPGPLVIPPLDAQQMARVQSGAGATAGTTQQGSATQEDASSGGIYDLADYLHSLTEWNFLWGTQPTLPGVPDSYLRNWEIERLLGPEIMQWKENEFLSPHEVEVLKAAGIDAKDPYGLDRLLAGVDLETPEEKRNRRFLQAWSVIQKRRLAKLAESSDLASEQWYTEMRAVEEAGLISPGESPLEKQRTSPRYAKALEDAKNRVLSGLVTRQQAVEKECRETWAKRDLLSKYFVDIPKDEKVLRDIADFELVAVFETYVDLVEARHKAREEMAATCRMLFETNIINRTDRLVKQTARDPFVRDAVSTYIGTIRERFREEQDRIIANHEKKLEDAGLKWLKSLAESAK